MKLKMFCFTILDHNYTYTGTDEKDKTKEIGDIYKFGQMGITGS